MNLSSRILLLLPCLALVLSACEIKKDAKSMLKTTRRVEDSSRHLEKRMDDMNGDLSFKESDDVLTARLEKLFAERDADNVGASATVFNYFFGLNDESDLFKTAEVAVRAMYYQYWKGDYSHNIAELDSRMALTARSVLATLVKHTPRDGDVDVLRPGQSFRGIGALGSAMEIVNPQFHQALAKNNLPDSVFYDTFILALRNRFAASRTEQYPLAIKEILRREPEAVYLLQLRHNTLPMIVVARMTDFQERGDARRLWMMITGQNVNLNLVNPESLLEWTEWLEQAIKTRADLKSVGIEPLYNQTLRRLVGSVDFGQKAILARPMASATTERAKLELRFARAYTTALQQATPAPTKPWIARPLIGESKAR